MNDGRRNGLDAAVERRRARREAWLRNGERPLARNLALVGTLGWLIVVPTLAGVLVGRWIDRRAGTGVTFTAALLCLGVVLGCWFAWRKVGTA